MTRPGSIGRRLVEGLSKGARWPHAGRTLLACALIAVAALSGRAVAQPADQVPAELEGVDIVEKLGARLPLDLPFVDDQGNAIRLGDLFDGERPVILQLGYYKCPMLCGLVLNEMVKGLKGVDFNAGESFRVVSVSVNPNETYELAEIKKKGYLLEYGRPGASKGWHFLVGKEEDSRALADAVGFKYRFVPSTGEYAHAAALFICTPDGRLSRVLYGVRFEPNDIRLATLEASEGRIGSTLDRIILWCHIYDPNAQGYVLFAFRVMQLAGLFTVVLLGAGLGALWYRDLRSRRRAATERVTA